MPILGEMDAAWLFVLAWTTLVLSRTYLSFGPTRHGWFNRAFPRRHAQDLFEILVWAIAWLLFAPAMMLSDSHGMAWLLLFFVPYSLGFGAVALLGRRATAAGEPTWGEWKASLPARPDR